jgi:CheY-like chemotaxis protein
VKPNEVNILIADDDDELLQTLVELFKPFQFNIDTANNGAEAWELIQKKSYNLLLSDVRMPEMDGLELLKKVKTSHPVHPSILFISGYTDVLNEEIYHLGAEGKFEKPFNIKAVRKAIQICLLEPEAKWAIATELKKTLDINKSAETIEELEEKKIVLFGRGGFFMAHSTAPVPKETVVAFTIEVKSPTPILFKGIGVTQWSCGYNAKYPAGLGIKIISMEPEQTKIYHKLFGERIPFIPSHRKMNRD